MLYLNVNKSLQLFWCFQMRMRTSFVNLVRPLPSEDKSHKWHLSHPIVYSCCCLFFKFNSVRIPNLLLYVLVNTSAMHFADASRIASSMENDTLRFCWKIFDYHMIFTNQFDRNGGSVGSIYFLCAPPSRSPNACLCSPMRRKKITPVLQARQGVAWHSQQQVID